MILYENLFRDVVLIDVNEQENVFISTTESGEVQVYSLTSILPQFKQTVRNTHSKATFKLELKHEFLISKLQSQFNEDTIMSIKFLSDSNLVLISSSKGYVMVYDTHAYSLVGYLNSENWDKKKVESYLD